MQSAVRMTTKVLPDGKIELQLPPESAGDEVEIFIILPEKPVEGSLSAIDIINRPLPTLFNSPEDVDQYLRAERDSWER